MRRPVLLITIGVAVVLALVVLPLRSPSTVTGTHAMPCADLDGDGEVTQDDVDIVSSYFGKTVPPAPAAADMNGDDLILTFDAGFVQNEVGNFTTCQDTPIGLQGAPTPTPTPTPTPVPGVGGIAELPDVVGAPLATGESSGLSAGVLAGIAAGATAGAIALGGAAWYARRTLR